MSQQIKNIDTSSDALSDDLSSSYYHAATSDNTRVAYQSDVRHFL